MQAILVKCPNLLEIIILQFFFMTTGIVLHERMVLGILIKGHVYTELRKKFEGQCISLAKSSVHV